MSMTNDWVELNGFWAFHCLMNLWPRTASPNNGEGWEAFDPEEMGFSHHTMQQLNAESITVFAAAHRGELQLVDVLAGEGELSDELIEKLQIKWICKFCYDLRLEENWELRSRVFRKHSGVLVNYNYTREPGVPQLLWLHSANWRELMTREPRPLDYLDYIGSEE